jgi:hypothetical protein
MILGSFWMKIDQENQQIYPLLKDYTFLRAKSLLALKKKRAYNFP